MLATEESLSALFAKLGIANMLDGAPGGAYALDWGHIKLDVLDSYVERNSTGKYGEGRTFPLWHTTETPAAESFGEIEEPYVIARDGTRYTFIEASYRDGTIMVKTRFQEAGDESSVEGLYPVSTLRTIINPLPTRKKHRRSWFWHS